MKDILKKLEELQNAGLRLGQIFENIRAKNGDLFHISDEKIESELDDMLKNVVKGVMDGK